MVLHEMPVGPSHAIPHSPQRTLDGAHGGGLCEAAGGAAAGADPLRRPVRPGGGAAPLGAGPQPHPLRPGLAPTLPWSCLRTLGRCTARPRKVGRLIGVGANLSAGGAQLPNNLSVPVFLNEQNACSSSQDFSFEVVSFCGKGIFTMPFLLN